jgi:hypothetical protein
MDEPQQPELVACLPPALSFLLHLLTLWVARNEFFQTVPFLAARGPFSLCTS